MADSVAIAESFCAICLKKPEASVLFDAFAKIRVCGHIFCAVCLLSWFEKDPRINCPICRRGATYVSLIFACRSPNNEDEEARLTKMVISVEFFIKTVYH